MTSEVVVMNRLGIALASDSAATVYVGGRAKFYHADKLFMLSNQHPVGVMVYNNSSLLGVPWETILKMFRAERGEKKFDTLEEHAAYLIDYLSTNEELFPPDEQHRHYILLVTSFFNGISERVNKELVIKFRDDSEDGPAIVKEVQQRVVMETLKEWQGKKDADPNSFGTGIGKKLLGTASSEISNLVAEYFDGAEAPVVDALYELARLVVDKEEILPESLSGLVIAGFGAKQHFPVMQEYQLGEIFAGRLKFNCIDTSHIGPDTPSVVKPFAQSEMVETFLEGVSPAFDLKLTREAIQIIVNSPNEIIDGITGISKQKKKEYKEKVREISKEAARSFVHNLRKYRRNKHLQPILQSIEFLPKNELAHVAQSLVNLSSFQKRMSISEDETVGGPIDVAVISKGDGFVWIDRKHYFKPELNRHFFQSRGLETSVTSGGDNGEKKQGE